jgi:hypothetical protein
MKKVTLRKNAGITLVALVITIIVLLILAGVTINLTIGDGGIIKTAQQAGKNYVEAAENEQTQLAEFWNETGNIIGSSTSSSSSSSSNNSSASTNNISSTVNMVTVANGETVPVPKGFFYVGGNLSTGVIISDNSADQYDGKTDKTSWDYAPSLQGNQFVWIPCSVSEYKKNTAYSTNGIYYDTSTNGAELTQIKKYGGFYVARYEAGTSKIEGISFSTITSNGTSSATNYTNVTKGNVTSKADEIPWFHTDYYTAVEMATRMYQGNSSVNSGLITGTQWDVMVTVMNAKTGCNVASDSRSWGNYSNTAWTITRGSYCVLTSSYAHGAWVPVSSSYEKASGSYVIFSTASNASFEKYNIYDVAGNINEWTQESSMYDAFYACIRGGCYIMVKSYAPAASRGPGNMEVGRYVACWFPCGALFKIEII